MFMLKHVKDVRSPIAMAKEKQAALLGAISLQRQPSRRDAILMRSVPKSPLRSVTYQDKSGKALSKGGLLSTERLTADNLSGRHNY